MAQNAYFIILYYITIILGSVQLLKRKKIILLFSKDVFNGPKVTDILHTKKFK